MTDIPTLEPGLEIGELTLVGLTGEKRSSGSPVWECKCQCGRTALRPAIALRRSLRNHATPMCQRCLVELRRGLFIDRRSSRAIAFAEAFEEYGDLYVRAYDAQEQEDIIDEIEAEGIPVRAPEALSAPPALDGYSVWEPRSPSKRGGAWDLFYPMRLPRPGLCDLCNRRRKDGFGCVKCLSYMCVRCVRDGKHCSCRPSSAAMTLEEIGREFGVSRERIRQIEIRGLRKIRENNESLWLSSYEIEERELSQTRTVGSLRKILGMDAPWVREVIENKSWRPVASFVAAFNEASKRQQHFLRFALLVASDADVAWLTMSAHLEHVRRAQEAASKEREERKREEYAERSEERREIRLAAAKAEREGDPPTKWERRLAETEATRERHRQEAQQRAAEQRAKNEHEGYNRILRGEPATVLVNSMRYRVVVRWRIEKATIHVDSENLLDLMVLSTGELEEMRVTGYGKQRGLEHVTGSVNYKFVAPWADEWCIVLANPNAHAITVQLHVEDVIRGFYDGGPMLEMNRRRRYFA